MVSTEEIVLERRSASGGKAEETSTSGDSLAQHGKGAVLMVCKTCGKKGDHWTSRCPYKDLSSQAEEFMTDRPPSADATAALSIANNSTYVPPSRRAGSEGSIGMPRIGNLSEDAQDTDLVELCYGFVSFICKEDVERAIEKLNGCGYDNLILSVEWSARTK
ncbi:hypothetical protein CsSME_00017324 [Camellia sinensis var. sinensis]